ncbi:MAG: GDSL-type esterase/lipase family protein [Clostridia bacterium]|nr:GDSL-type esterase/lipase family protein [Clostridia bacterium]
MAKRRILCFGDSLTWGYNPDTKERYDENTRWTGILQNLFKETAIVVEEGQNGRTIATDDPAEGEKNGLKYIEPCMESQKPFDVIVIMLGSNDLKRKFNYAAMDIAGEMEIMIRKVKSYIHFSMNDSAEILLISPPLIGEKIRDSWLGDSFGYERAREVSSELNSWYKMIAQNYGCSYINAADYISASDTDSCHLTIDGNAELARVVYNQLISMLDM